MSKMSNSDREILGDGCSPKVALFARCVACDAILVMHNLRRDMWCNSEKKTKRNCILLFCFWCTKFYSGDTDSILYVLGTIRLYLLLTYFVSYLTLVNMVFQY